MLLRGALVGLILLLPAPAVAGLLSSCILTVNTSGTLKVSGDGMSLGSQNTGGLPAVMLMVAVDMTPQLIFSAPNLTSPPGWSASPVTSLSVDTLSGVHTNYTTGAFTVNPAALTDTVSINAQVASNSGFKAGSYTVASTVTCQAG